MHPHTCPSRQPARSVEDCWMRLYPSEAQVATFVTSASSTFRAARSFWLTRTLTLASSPSSVDSVISPSHAPSDCVPTYTTTTTPLSYSQFCLPFLSFPWFESLCVLNNKPTKAQIKGERKAWASVGECVGVLVRQSHSHSSTGVGSQARAPAV